MNAAITYTMPGGVVFRQCTRCQMKVLESGHPDPTWYTDAFLSEYYRVPANQRCKHERAPDPQKSNRELQLENTLRAVRDTINRALGE